MVHSGEEIVQWRNAGWHEQPDHQNFRDLLAQPKAAAKALMKSFVYVTLSHLPPPSFFTLQECFPYQNFLSATKAIGSA